MHFSMIFYIPAWGCQERHEFLVQRSRLNTRERRWQRLHLKKDCTVKPIKLWNRKTWETTKKAIYVLLESQVRRRPVYYLRIQNENDLYITWEFRKKTTYILPENSERIQPIYYLRSRKKATYVINITR